MSAEAGFSICAWFMLEPTAKDWVRVFDFGDGRGETGVVLSRHSSNRFLQAEHRHDYDAQSFPSPNVFRLGDWRHVCVVNKGTAWSIIENGVLSADYEAWFGVTVMELTYNYIGRSFSYSDRLLQGKIDEFRIYKRALSRKEAADIFAYRGDIRSALHGFVWSLCV
jgi:hypothetical protein